MTVDSHPSDSAVQREAEGASRRVEERAIRHAHYRLGKCGMPPSYIGHGMPTASTGLGCWGGSRDLPIAVPPLLNNAGCDFKPLFGLFSAKNYHFYSNPRLLCYTVR